MFDEGGIYRESCLKLFLRVVRSKVASNEHINP